MGVLPISYQRSSGGLHLLIAGDWLGEMVGSGADRSIEWMTK